MTMSANPDTTPASLSPFSNTTTTSSSTASSLTSLLSSTSFNLSLHIPLPLPLLYEIKNIVIGNPSKKKELILHSELIHSLIRSIAPSHSTLNSSSSSSSLKSRDKGKKPLNHPTSSSSSNKSQEPNTEHLLLQQRIQATIILGSLAMWHDPQVSIFSNLNAASSLLSCLTHPNLEFLEAITRAIKAMLMNPYLSKNALLQDSSLLTFLSLLDHSFSSSPKLAASCAFILAKACDHEGIQDFLASQQPLSSFLQLLTHPFTLESGLYLLASFCREHPTNGKLLLDVETINHRPFLPELLSYTRDKRPYVQLYATTCLTYLFRSQLLCNLSDPIHLHILPCVVRLFDAPLPISEQACLVFASLVQDSEEMQQTASDMDTLPKLADMLRRLHFADEIYTRPKASYCEAVLLAIAAVASLHEPCRKLICQHHMLPWIVKKLNHSHLGVRSAACQCLRSISRSVKQLRSTLLDAGIVEPLFQLLNTEEEINVLVPVSAVLCNLVLDFTPMKQMVVEKGGIEKIASFTEASDSQLRLNSIWALKNLAYNASSTTKHKLIETIGFTKLKR